MTQARRDGVGWGFANDRRADSGAQYVSLSRDPGTSAPEPRHWLFGGGRAAGHHAVLKSARLQKGLSGNKVTADVGRATELTIVLKDQVIDKGQKHVLSVGGALISARRRSASECIPAVTIER